MRIQLHDWLQARVDDPLYQQLIWWQDKQKKKLAIHWKHASFSDYENGDSVLFKSWAIQNSKYKSSRNSIKYHSCKHARWERETWHVAIKILLAFAIFTDLKTEVNDPFRTSIIKHQNLAITIIQHSYHATMPSFSCRYKIGRLQTALIRWAGLRVLLCCDK